MGLSERRAAEAFKNGPYVELKKQIDAAAGFEVPVDVKWDKLATEHASNEKLMTEVYFTPFIEAFKAIAVDDMGKSALKGGLKQITITDENHFCGPEAYKFEGGVLSVDHYIIDGDLDYRIKIITDLLSNAL